MFEFKCHKPKRVFRIFTYNALTIFFLEKRKKGLAFSNHYLIYYVSTLVMIVQPLSRKRTAALTIVVNFCIFQTNNYIDFE